MKLKIKVCGLREEKSFTETAALNLDFLGLIFVESSKRKIELSDAERFGRMNRGKAQLTGVFQDQDLGFICEVVQAARLDCVQLHGSENYACELKHLLPHVKVLKAVNAESLQSADPAGVDYFLVDNKQGGSGEKFDWSLLSAYQGSTQLIVAGGIGIEDADKILELSKSIPQVSGIDINSRFELSPGIKDIAKIKEFHELLFR